MNGYSRLGGDGYRAAAAYRESRVMSSTPVEVVVMLYERLLADLRGAAIAIRAHNVEVKTQRVQRAMDVIFELLSALDRAQGGEVSQRLAALYSYMISTVGDASRRLDADALDGVADHVESLLQAWTAVAAEPAIDPPSPPATR